MQITYWELPALILGFVIARALSERGPHDGSDLVGKADIAPPGTHWFPAFLSCCVGLLLGFPFLHLVWLYAQGRFVKRIDPASPCQVHTGVAAVLLLLAQLNGPGSGSFFQWFSWDPMPSFTYWALHLVFVWLAVFSMAGSLEHHSARVERLFLPVNRLALFFGSVFYLQAQFARLATFKRFMKMAGYRIQFIGL